MKCTSRDSRSSLATTTGHFNQRGSQLWAAIQSVRTLARLDLDELGCDLDPLGLCKAGAGGALRLDTKARTALLRKPGGKKPSWPIAGL
jgi:hypothetical protein